MGLSNKKSYVFLSIPVITFAFYLSDNAHNHSEIVDIESNKMDNVSHFNESSVKQALAEIQIKSQYINTSEPSQTIQLTQNNSNISNRQLLSEPNNDCINESVVESSYHIDAFLANSQGLDDTINHLIHNLNNCSTVQSREIISQLFENSETRLQGFNLAIELLKQTKQTGIILAAIKATDFTSNEIESIMEENSNVPINIKSALIPSLLRNDDLDNLIKLTSYDYLYNNISNRNGEPFTSQQATNYTNRLLQTSVARNLDSSGQVYPYLLETYPTLLTSPSLTKHFISTTQTNQEL